VERRAVLGYAGQVFGDIVLLVTGLLNPMMAATVVVPGRHVRNEELLRFGEKCPRSFDCPNIAPSIPSDVISITRTRQSYSGNGQHC
jgi:hypothetical protein